MIIYYYGARYYNPATALWLGVDPLASKKPNVSPYLYCLGNPINFIDPDGRDEESHNNVMSVFASRDHGIAYDVILNDVIIEGTKFQYDQPYGQTITRGVGSGVETTSKYKGPSIDASEFSYPFGGGNKSIGEILYNLSVKAFSIMCNMFSLRLVLKNARKAAGITQKQLAEKIEKKREYIAMLEKGETDMHFLPLL